MKTEHVKLGGDGRIVIPASVRRELGLKPGSLLAVESDGDSLLVRSYDAVLRETQDYFRRFAPGGGVVADLIADRRAEAARDEVDGRPARPCRA